MKSSELLRAKRAVFLLVEKHGKTSTADPEYWSMRLDGLSRDSLKASAKSLRSEREKVGKPLSENPQLKVSGLHSGLALALGAKSFDHWCEAETNIVNFLAKNGMHEPADLIQWSRVPGLQLSARQVADRLFNSGLPMPKRLFTGVGSKLFMAKGRGRLDMCNISRKMDIVAQFEWCMDRADEVVLTLAREFDWDADAPDILHLTGKDLMLHAFRFDKIAAGYNLLGDNLVYPKPRPFEFRLYPVGPSAPDLTQRVFEVFRNTIESSDMGWVEILPLPGNDNIVFLKGVDGTFDWVVRDQRDEAFSGNPYHPFLKADEVPEAMKVSKFAGDRYFRRAEWHERLEHEAEDRHYREGGDGSNWPGYEKLLLREFIASHGYRKPRPQTGLPDQSFVSHRLQEYCLLVSPLITLRQWRRFLDETDWLAVRETRWESNSKMREPGLAAVNDHDDDRLPASVTWYDAARYCRYVEAKTGLPVRLMLVEEWHQIRPEPLPGRAEPAWGVVGGDGLIGYESRDLYSDGGFLRFSENLAWLQNREGLSFLSVKGFGEWLGDFSYGDAPAANAATGESLHVGPLERVLSPASLSRSGKGMKVGFRICYVAEPDA